MNRTSQGWAEVSRERKREIIEAIAANKPTRGPVHIELDLTDRCNVACYFCNQQDLRTKDSVQLPRLTDLIDELAGNGLRSVRLSGGGDPLFHKDITATLDHLHARGVVIDNLTTNGVALTEEISRRLVAHKAREVILSLNAADAEDYARMMRVKADRFDLVITNVKKLIAMRDESMYPSVTVQFLIDKQNITRLVDMYELAKSIGVDRIAINAVLEIPLERIDRERLLTPEDRDVAEPYIEEILRRDLGVGMLQVDFAISGWNEMLWRLRDRVKTPAYNSFPTASSFKEENAGCFYGWYTAAITGTGDIRPCCLLLSPSVEPLGNINDGTFTEQWTGPGFTQLRDEMREVLLMKQKLRYAPQRFKAIKEPCVRENACWLKNMYFRHDEEFYAELDVALEKARRREIRWIGTPKQFKRRMELFVLEHPRARNSWDWFRETTRPARIALKRRFGLQLTDA